MIPGIPEEVDRRIRAYVFTRPFVRTPYGRGFADDLIQTARLAVLAGPPDQDPVIVARRAVDREIKRITEYGYTVKLWLQPPEGLS